MDSNYIVRSFNKRNKMKIIIAKDTCDDETTIEVKEESGCFQRYGFVVRGKGKTKSEAVSDVVGCIEVAIERLGEAKKSILEL